MVSEDNQDYLRLLHLSGMKGMLVDLTTYVSQEIALGPIQVNTGELPPENLKSKFLVAKIKISGDLEGEILFALSLNIALTNAAGMLEKPKSLFKEYIDNENYDSDMQDASGEILNLATGALERIWLKQLDSSFKCSLGDSKLVDFADEKQASEVVNGAYCWVMQSAKIDEFEVDGMYLHAFPEPVADQMVQFISQNLALEDARQELDAAGAVKVGQTQTEDPSGKKQMKILVVEDTHTMSRLIGEHLEQAGYMVIYKNEGARALRWANLISEYLKLIILDIQISDLDGFEIIKALSMGENTKDIPILATSSNISQNDVIRLSKLGIRNLLVKPFTREALIGKVISIAGRP